MQIKASDLVINQDLSVKAPDDKLILTNDLPPGTYVFQLVVMDDALNKSAPATLRVVVRDTVNPTAVISGPQTVGTAEDFTLSATGSSDVAPGTIATFLWTRLAQ